jgi:hypothetical protein
MNDKILYRSDSSSNTFSFVLISALYVFVIFVCAAMFHQRPGMSIMGMVGAFVLLLSTSRGSIIVFGDRLVILNKRLLPGFSDSQEFSFAGIVKIEANLSVTPGTDLLSFLFSSSYTARTVKNILSITNKDGSTVDLSPKIYKAELRKAIECIHAHSHIKIDIQGDDI